MAQPATPSLCRLKASAIGCPAGSAWRGEDAEEPATYGRRALPILCRSLTRATVAADISIWLPVRA